MRNAFVVLVSLCIGVVSGFIVPSSTTETTEKNYIYSTATSKNATVKSVNPPKSAVLPKNRTNIDEKDLFEHATERKNNQIERAYIYINQKYDKRKHPRNKLIKMAHVDKPGLASANEVSPPTLMKDRIPCINCQDTITPAPNSKYQGFLLHDSKQVQENFLDLKAPDMFRWNFKDNSRNTENVKTQTAPTSKPEERYEYIELLKTPLFRPDKPGPGPRPGKVNFKKITRVDVPPGLHSSINRYNENIIKSYLKNQHLLKLKEAVARENEKRRNYGFNSALIRHPYQTNEVRNRAEEINFINEGNNHKKYEMNQDEDKLLGKYLKDTLDDNISLPHEAVRPDYEQEDCIKPRKKYTKTSTVFIKPDCSCSRNMRLKQVDPFVLNDRQLREDKRDSNETLPSSSELINYEEMLSEDSNIVKDDNYGIKPPNTRKVNNT